MPVGGRCRYCGTEDAYADGWEAGYIAALDAMVAASDTAPTRPGTRTFIHTAALRLRRVVDTARTARGLT